LGAALAKALGCPFVDADDLHPQTNIDKMSTGMPLTDADRAPWLVNVRSTALKVAEGDSTEGTAGAVVACSALKVRYREVLRGKLAELDSAIHPVCGFASGSGHGGAHPEEKQNVRGGLSPPSTWRTFFVHPFGPREVLMERMMTRKSHFMGANMLASQLDALENPSGTGEADVVPVGLGEGVGEQVRIALEGLTVAGAVRVSDTSST
jgi:gluconokinase